MHADPFHLAIRLGVLSSLGHSHDYPIILDKIQETEREKREREVQQREKGILKKKKKGSGVRQRLQVATLKGGKYNGLLCGH